MQPNHIMNEVVRRLTNAQARRLARSVRLDLDEPLPPLEMQTFGSPPFQGRIDFDITIVALGHSVSLPARLLWAAAPGDEDDHLGHRTFGTQSTLHVLIPTLEDRTAFMWSNIDQRMLPAAADYLLHGQVEELARAEKVASGKPPS